MQGIQMQGITMRFGEKTALQEINIEIKEGTIHAIVGENGAGKSTLMNILSGALKPNKGKIRIDGREVFIKSPQDATREGIGMVYQHFMLVQHLPVWQNLILGIEPVNRIGKINEHKAREWIMSASKTYHMQINPDEETGSLTVGEQQRVEILKVLVRNAKYIIFDEPTAVLTPQEIDILLENILTLKKLGKTIIFISHKLDEVFRIADEITVLRYGEKIGTVLAKETNPHDLISMMIGRKVSIEGVPASNEPGEAVLRINGITTPRSTFSPGIRNLSLCVRSGEVLGIAGVDGNGQTELVDAVLGFTPVTKGQIYQGQRRITNLSPSKIRAGGLSLIAPDRHKQGLVLNSSLIRNLVLGVENHPYFSKLNCISQRKVTKIAGQMQEKFDIRLPGLDVNASSLSGGNQQKIVLAREFGLRDSKLVIAVNPTRGLDVGAIEFVYAEIERQKCAGKAILLVSTELSEILRLSDRIAVLYQGQCVGIMKHEDANVERIGRMMMGLEREGVD